MEWREVRLGDLGIEIRGSVKPETGTRYELWSVPAFPTGRPELADGKEIGSNKRTVKPGDLLLCKINPRINRVWMVSECEDGRPQLASTEYLVLRVADTTLARYLMWYLRGPKFRSWIELAVEGATGSHTRAKSRPILDQLIPVPPLAEQSRLVAAIEEQTSRLDDALRSVTSAQARLPKMRRAVLAVAQTGGEKRELGEVVDDIEAGRSFRTDGRRAGPEEWAVIKVSAMTWGRFLEQENKALPHGTKFDGRFEIKPGDVLLSRANTSEYVGATVHVEKCRPRLLLSDKSMRLHPAAGVDARWLTHALNSPDLRQQMSLVATGTSDSMRNISQEKVKQLQLLVPSLDDQVRLAEEVERRLSVIDALATTVDHSQLRADGLRRSVLGQAFTGRLVPQDPNEGGVSALLERIAAADTTADKRRRRKRA